MTAMRNLIAAARDEAQRLRANALMDEARGARATEADADRWQHLAVAAETEVNQITRPR